MASLMTLIEEIWEPMWKWRSCKQDNIPLLSNWVTTSKIWGIVRPHFAPSPVELPQCPDPRLLSLALTPKVGEMPNFWLISKTKANSDCCSITTTGFCPNPLANKAVSR